MTEQAERAKRFFMRNLAYFVVALVSVVYVATSFINIDKTGKTVTQILADGSIVFLLGVFVDRLFELQGLQNGEMDERVMRTVMLHEDTVNKVVTDIDELDDWCEMENRRNYKLQRQKILARAGLKYDDCFDEDGVSKPLVVKHTATKREQLKQKRVYEYAVKLKLTYLNAGDLTSDGGKKEDPFYFGKTKVQYGFRSNMKDVFSKIITVVLFGYYGATLITDFNYADLIWKCLQIALFFMMGVVKMIQAYMFMTGEYRSRIIKKIDILQKFMDYIGKKKAVSASAEPSEQISEGRKSDAAQ